MKWSAQIHIEKEELVVAWFKDGSTRKCGLPYGLSREDVEAAIIQGP